MQRRALLKATALVLSAGLGLAAPVQAQQPPIKIGMSMPATGGLAAGGKSSLIGWEQKTGTDIVIKMPKAYAKKKGLI